MVHFLLLTIFGILAVVNSQITFPGSCHNVTTQQNFDIKKYMGDWYEIKKYPTIFQTGASCLKVNYVENKHRSVRVDNSMLLYGYYLKVYGIMKEVNPNLKDGKFEVNFPQVQASNSEIWILSTDYTNYSIVWHCRQMNDSNEQFAWILSRTPSINETLQTQINSILVENNLDLGKLLDVNQTDCEKFYGHGSASNSHINVGLIFVMITMASYKLVQ